MKLISVILIVLCFSGIVFSQDKGILDTTFYSTDTTFQKFRPGSSPIPLFTILGASFFYLLNPIIIYEDDKIGLGITKQFSVGFGYYGENRLTFEFTKIFRDNYSYIIRLGYTNDFLLNKKLVPSNNFQGTSVVPLGISYYTEFSHNGMSLETGFGYSIRNHKMLICPHLKVRYTHIFESGKSNIIDFSFGVMVGLANPFKDMKIRRNYEKRSSDE